MVREAVGQQTEKQVNLKPGRPRAIPRTLIPRVLTLYRGGLGYRAISRELRAEGISANWSTIRRVIKAKIDGTPNKRQASEGF